MIHTNTTNTSISIRLEVEGFERSVTRLELEMYDIGVLKGDYNEGGVDQKRSTFLLLQTKASDVFILGKWRKRVLKRDLIFPYGWHFSRSDKRTLSCPFSCIYLYPFLRWRARSVCIALTFLFFEVGRRSRYFSPAAAFIAIMIRALLWLKGDVSVCGPIHSL
jgi:hypothetical protein